METLFDLIKELKINKDVFLRALNNKNPTRYKVFTIKKRNKTLRTIEAPQDEDLIKTQKKINEFLKPIYYEYKPKCVHGFIEKHDIKTNALVHNDNHEYIIKFDIKDYFPSITYIRVYELFRKIFKTFTGKIEAALVSLVTYNDHLPQGAPTSPLIANMISKRFDRKMSSYCRQFSAQYTRYADDVTISLNSIENCSFFVLGQPNTKSLVVRNEIIEIFSSNGFNINFSKISFISKKRCQKVCGVVLGKKLNVRKQFYAQLRREIHELEIKRNSNFRKVIGKISFMRHIKGRDDLLTCRLATRLNRLMSPPFPDSDFYLDKNNAANFYCVRIRTLEAVGTAFFINGFLITSVHVLENTVDPLNKNHSFEYSPYNEFVIESCDFNDPSRLSFFTVKNPVFYKYNEIAFVKFKDINRYESRFLKLVNNNYQKFYHKQVYSLGVDFDGPKLIINSINKSSINGKSIVLGSNCFVLNKNTINKMMSGGPLLDANSFCVVGVNYLGNDPTREDDCTSSCASILDHNILKNIKLWIEDPLLEKLRKIKLK